MVPTGKIEIAGPVPSVSRLTMLKLFERPVYSKKSDSMIIFHCAHLTQRLYCFSGPKSAYILSYPIKLSDNKGFQITGQYYTSIDHYMWTMKFKELINKPLPPKSQIIGYRGILRDKFVTVERSDEWMLERGLLHLQKAILRRVQMDPDFYSKLVSSGDKVLFYTYYKDKFLGTGGDMYEVRRWFQDCAMSNLVFQVPNKFPLTMTDLKHLPFILGGLNVLGAIYMALREQLKHHDPWHMKVEIPPLKVAPPPYPNSFGNLPSLKRRNKDNIESIEPKRRDTDSPTVSYPSSINETLQSNEQSRSALEIRPSASSKHQPSNYSFVADSTTELVQYTTPIKQKMSVQKEFHRHRQSFASITSATSTQFHSAVTNCERIISDLANKHKSYTSASTITQHTPVITPATSFARLDLDTPKKSGCGKLAMSQEVSVDRQRLMEAAESALPLHVDEHCSAANSSTEAHERLMLAKEDNPFGISKCVTYEHMPTPEHVPDDCKSITPTEEARLLGEQSDCTDCTDIDDDELIRILGK